MKLKCLQTEVEVEGTMTVDVWCHQCRTKLFQMQSIVFVDEPLIFVDNKFCHYCNYSKENQKDKKG